MPTPEPDFQRLRVRVPGSTSNLGPGFDFLGLALDLWLDVTVIGSAAGPAHEFARLEGEAQQWPTEDDNAFTRAFEVAAGTARARGSRFEVRSEIPIGRGFGSSGAATVAGLLLGHAHANDAPSEARLLSEGAELEGHPDNATASLLGGCTLAIPRSATPATANPRKDEDTGQYGDWRVIRQELAPSIWFAIAWPPNPLPTPEGRRALPAEVPFADAIENPRRVAALLEGLRTGDPELLALGGQDKLHARYRAALIPGAERALASAHAAGAWLATISGSGSGLVALGPQERCEEIADAMAAELEREQGAASGRVVRPVLERAEVSV